MKRAKVGYARRSRRWTTGFRREQGLRRFLRVLVLAVELTSVDQLRYQVTVTIRVNRDASAEPAVLYARSLALRRGLSHLEALLSACWMSTAIRRALSRGRGGQERDVDTNLAARRKHRKCRNELVDRRPGVHPARAVTTRNEGRGSRKRKVISRECGGRLVALQRNQESALLHLLLLPFLPVSAVRWYAACETVALSRNL